MNTAEFVIRRFVRSLWILPEASSHRGLSIYPIYRSPRWHRDDARPHLRYLPLDVAISKSKASVSEMPSAHVPELLVENRAKVPVLAIDGDELVGGRQNRSVNTSVLLAKGKTAVPVSCVEEGRWHEVDSSFFCGGERLTHGLRARSHGAVHRNLNEQQGHASDQRAIWREIGSGHARHGTSSQTSALNDIYQAKGKILSAYTKALPYPEDAIGLVTAIGTRLVGCDIFDQARTARHYWSRILRACAAEALNARHQTPSDDPSELLTALLDCSFEEFDSPGLGRDIRLKGDNIFGSALLLEDTVVHLGIFTGSPEQEENHAI